MNAIDSARNLWFNAQDNPDITETNISIELLGEVIHMYDAKAAETLLDELRWWPSGRKAAQSSSDERNSAPSVVADEELVERCVEATFAQFAKEQGTMPDPYEAARICIRLTREAAASDRDVLAETSWREGFQAARECLTDDEAFTLTEDVEEDCWRDSKARAALVPLGGGV